jgi:hypothetical protein
MIDADSRQVVLEDLATVCEGWANSIRRYCDRTEMGGTYWPEDKAAIKLWRKTAAKLRKMARGRWWF